MTLGVLWPPPRVSPQDWGDGVDEPSANFAMTGFIEISLLIWLCK